MDIVTQGIAGAVMAQSAASRETVRHATVTGFIAGLLADIDVLIRSADDPLLNLEFHRQFTHSLLFIPVGGLIAAAIIWPFLRNKLSFARVYLFSTAGFATSGLLDACTSFGTQLLWPFSDARIAWNLISVIDPVFTLILIAAALIAWKTRATTFSLLGILFALFYLFLGYNQQKLATNLQQRLAENRAHIIERSVIKPTLGNILLWRSVYQSRGRYYVDGLRIGLFGEHQVYAGKSIEVYEVDSKTIDLAKDLPQQRDILRFKKLSRNYLVKHPEQPYVVGDIRYSMLANSVIPLWGIRLDPGRPDKHVETVVFRKRDTETRREFIRMLAGR
jgi:inner membrane protein